MFRFCIFCLSILNFITLSVAAITIKLDNNAVPRYQVLEITLQSDTPLNAPFSRAVSAVFTAPDGGTLCAGGFYDGDSNWKIRFMPNRTGSWKVRWSFDSYSGEKSFTCTAQTHPKIHGHFYIDPSHPRKLRYEDGTPLFWHGGKYLNMARPFGADDQQELSYPERLPTNLYVDYCRTYFDKIAALGLNGAVFKVQTLPLLYNLQEMDLTFLKAMDEIVTSAMWNGINLQLNLFDTWGKRKIDVDWAVMTPEAADWLLLEPWDKDTYVEETRFFLEYMVNRYAAFPNVMWELWNEAERLKISANSPTQLYRSIIKSIDPYDLLIGASEMYTALYSLDACHAHLKYKCWPDQWDFMQWAVRNDKRFSPYYFTYNMPYIWNEIGPWDSDATHPFTEEERLSWFRAMFWSALTLGSAGISEDHWSDIRSVPDGISTYHSYFIRFVAQLSDVNALEPSDQIKPVNANGWLCRNGKKEMVAYLYTQKDDSRSDFDIYLEPGVVYYQFYNPRNGEWIGSRASLEIKSTGWRRFSTPSFDQDIVFYATSDQRPSSESPVEWGDIEGHAEKEAVLLQWRTYSETNNLGFNISRAADGADFSTIGFVSGRGTTNEEQAYTFTDRPPRYAHYIYLITQTDTDGATSSRQIEVNLSSSNFPVPAVFPNPTKGLTFITVPIHAGNCEIIIYNALGQITARESISNAGNESLYRWNGSNSAGERTASGLYFYQIISPEKSTPLAQGKFYLIH
jgi:hypothetical protein